MAAYNVFFKKSVEKDFEGIPKKNLTKIINKIGALAHDPVRPVVKNSQARRGTGCGRDNIVFYTPYQDNELTVWVVKVGHRKNIYR